MLTRKVIEFKIRLTARVNRGLRPGIMVFAVLLIAGAPGCDNNDNEDLPRFESAECPTPQEPIPALEQASCGFLVVPENRGKANGRRIRLAVAIIPSVSNDPAPDPIVHLTGGPGGSAISEAQFLVDSGLNADRDVIIMAQRGTLFSEPALTCPEIDLFNAEAIGLVYDADSTRDLHVAATRACHDRWVAEGVDLSAYNTTENAIDFAELRTTLGIDEWNVYAYSYGTYLALTLMREHPAGIRSVIIDSVLPPHVSTLGSTWGSAEEGFNNLFRACEDQPACRDSYPELAETFSSLVQEFEADPMTVSAEPPQGGPPVDVVIDGGSLVNWLVGAQPPLTKVPSAIDELVQGNPIQIATGRAALAHPSLVGEFGHGLTFGVFCSEWIPYEDESELLAQGRLAFPTYPDSVLAQAPQLPFLTEDCRVWSVPKAPASIREVTISSIPTLVLSGSFDARTSPRLGDFAAETLQGSTNIVIPGIGHWVTIKSPCAQSVIASFLSTPSAPDIACVAGLTPPPFETGE